MNWRASDPAKTDAGSPGLVAILLVACGVAFAVVDRGIISSVSAGALFVVVLFSWVRARDASTRLRAPLSSARTLIPLSLVALAVGSGGLDSSSSTLSAVVTLAAYPLIFRALLADVAEQRVIRPTDLLVEAILIGAGASIALRVGLLDSATGVQPDTTLIPILLVGFDVVMVVIVGRSFGVYSGRRSPLMWSAVAGTALLCGHTIAAVAAARSEELPTAATLLVSAGIVALATSLLHARFSQGRGGPVYARPGFSTTHAMIVVVGVLTPAAVLYTDARTGRTSTGEVIAGVIVASVVLAIHFIGLLQARAVSEHQATHDELTGLPNRALLIDRLERAIAHGARSQQPIGILSIDLDEFKNLNDSLGHHAGDDLLRATAHCLVDVSRAEDTVSRLARDEFVLVAPYLRDRDAVVGIAKRALEALDAPIEIKGTLMRNPVSIGVAIFPDDGDTAEQLLIAADTAMHRAKRNGGGCVEVFNNDLSVELAEVAEIERGLVRAIANDELELYYQPLVDPRTGLTTGAEALVRWNHPERGFLAPAAFIPIAEQSDLIVRLGEWVIDEACRELAGWAANGFTDRSIAVNVSGRHFSHDLVSTVTKSLRDAGANPANLTIEITESAAVSDLETVAAKLIELGELGVKASLDDFGTGFCGLRYLVDLPVQFLKIDRSFVADPTLRSEAIVSTTIAMGHALGMTIVAEGVETLDQLRFVVNNGCDLLQGFKIARPMPASDLLDSLRAEAAGGTDTFGADVEQPEFARSAAAS